MKSTQVIKCKQCSKLSLGRELPNEGRRHRTVCSQRRTHYTHEKKSQFGFGALLGREGS